MVSQRNKRFIATALVACGMTAAHADGLYVGGSLGAPNYSNSINGIGGGGGGDGTGLKLYGGDQLTPNFAVEGGLFSLGRSSDNMGTVKTRGAYLDAVGSYMFMPKWSVLGSLGVAQARFTTTQGNDSSPALKLGVGLQYDLTERVALRLQYDRYHFTNAFDTKPNVGAYAIGVKVGF